MLFAGEAPCPETPSDAAHDLLAHGFIKETKRTAEDGYSEKAFVVAAPLLATVMLKSMAMEVPDEVEPPPAGAESDVK